MLSVDAAKFADELELEVDLVFASSAVSEAESSLWLSPPVATIEVAPEFALAVAVAVVSDEI